MPIAESTANLIQIPAELAFKIELDVQDKFREYINNYFSPLALSEKWVKKKGNNLFYKNTMYSYYVLGIRFISDPAKWNVYEVDSSKEFRYSSFLYIPSKKQYRSFLPSEMPSFDRQGNPTKYLQDWINSIILLVLEKYFPESISEETTIDEL